MYDDFILTPISKNIYQVCSAMNGHQNIVAYPTLQYILNSLYLQVTGGIEQKLFFITWQTATNNTILRYNIFQGQQKGTSTLDAKEKLYYSLIREIREHTSKSPYIIPSKKLFDEAKDCIDIITTYHPLCDCFSKMITKYHNASQIIQSHIQDFEYRNIQKDSSHFLEELKTGKVSKEIENDKRKQSNGSLSTIRDGGLLGFKNDLLKTIYTDFVYKKRNALAHNVQKIPYPTISEIFDRNSYDFNNIFIHLLILTYIDNIFIHLYEDYMETINDKH